MNSLVIAGKLVFFSGAAMCAMAFMPFPFTRKATAGARAFFHPWLFAYGIVIGVIGFLIEVAGRYVTQ